MKAGIYLQGSTASGPCPLLRQEVQTPEMSHLQVQGQLVSHNCRVLEQICPTFAYLGDGMLWTTSCTIMDLFPNCAFLH